MIRKIAIFLFTFLVFQLIIFTAQALEKLTLVDYVGQVLKKSDQALALKDQLLFSKLDLDTAQFDYEFQWRPSVNLGLSNDIQTQGVGVEVKKKSEFGTEFFLGTSYNKLESDFGSSKSPKAYVRIEQGLFRQWGSEMGRLPLTRAELNNQRVFWSNIAQKQYLLRRAIQEYFSVLLAKRQLLLKLDTVKRQQENLAVAESRYGLDLVSKTDIYRAKLALLSAQDGQKTQQRALSRNFRSLANLINQTDIEVLRINEEVPAFHFVIPLQHLQIAMNYRSDWKLYNIDEKLAKLELSHSQRNLQPDIKLTLSADHYFDEYNVGNSNLQDKTDWRISLNYSTPFSLTREKNALIGQKLKVARQQRDKKALNREIQLELQDAREDIQLAKARFDIAKKRLTQSEKAVELALLRYQRGLSNNLDLVGAESELQSAQIETLRQQINLNMVIVDFAAKLGILDVKWLEATVNKN